MKILWSILCIGVLLPAIINATEYNINNDAKQKIKIGILTGILKSVPSHNQTGAHLVEIEGNVYFGEVNIEYLFSNLRLACILGYYPDMLYGTPGPKSLKQHLKVWEAKIANISSSNTSVKIEVQVFGAQWEDINTDWMKNTKNESFALFTIPHYAYTGEIGKSKLPMVTGVIEVPHKAKIEVEIIKANYKEVSPVGSIIKK